MVCIGVMLWARVKNYDLPHIKSTKFSMNRTVGLAVNVFALIYVSFNFVWMFFPLGSGFDPDLFNWAIAVFAFVFIVAVGSYVFERKGHEPSRHTTVD